MSRRRKKGLAGKVAATTAIIIAAAGATAAALGVDLASLGRPSESATTGVTPETADVTRQTLTETVTTSGDLGYGDALGLGSLLNGTITGLPAVGDVLGRGDELYAVDDRPVVLLFGTLPAYRTLSPGTEGQDVEQFEQNLEALGYDGFTVDDEYTDATAEAVEQWQDDLGLEETGIVDLGRVLYAPDQIRVDAIDVSLGDAAQPGAADLLTYTGLDKVVTVEVDLDDQELVVVGGPVAITLPDGTEASGTITDSETVVQEGDGQDAESTTILEVTVAADDTAVFDGLDQAAVDVGFAGASVEDVLTVPVEALLGLAEGGYGVETWDGATGEVIAVDTGLFADGFVEVTGEGLEEGVSVVVPS
jgi:hypothetical protein